MTEFPVTRTLAIILGTDYLTLAIILGTDYIPSYCENNSKLLIFIFCYSLCKKIHNHNNYKNIKELYIIIA